MEILEKMTCAGCFIGIAVSAADMIKPDDKFSAHIKMMFSVMFMMAFLSPVVKGDISETIKNSIHTNSDISYTSLSEAAENEMSRFIEDNIENSLSELMNTAEISFDEISVKININDDNSIDISEIYLDADDFDKAQKLIKKEIGKEVLIYEKSETKDTG
ncbi:MAG: stage III sporulation protein AF [Oscillospiraceae bacterium]|nr:stage III sporulation protein AF [Oscillospiraceae bacterium]MBQ9982632.1 stage III sporulation protein AF [Oscillospiraceae bacterium]